METRQKDVSLKAKDRGNLASHHVQLERQRNTTYNTTGAIHAGSVYVEYTRGFKKGHDLWIRNVTPSSYPPPYRPFSFFHFYDTGKKKK